MKKIFYILLLSLTISCSKENIDIDKDSFPEDIQNTEWIGKGIDIIFYDNICKVTIPEDFQWNNFETSYVYNNLDGTIYFEELNSPMERNASKVIDLKGYFKDNQLYVSIFEIDYDWAFEKKQKTIREFDGWCNMP